MKPSSIFSSRKLSLMAGLFATFSAWFEWSYEQAMHPDAGMPF